MKLFIYELRKILTFKTFLLIIAAFIAQIIASLIPHVYEHSYSTEVYKNYIAELEGEYTQAKRSTLEQRYVEINNLILEHDNIGSAYLRDEISIEEFEKHNFDYNKAKAERSTVEYLLQKCDHFGSLNGDALFFFLILIGRIFFLIQIIIILQLLLYFYLSFLYLIMNLLPMHVLCFLPRDKVEKIMYYKVNNSYFYSFYCFFFNIYAEIYCVYLFKRYKLRY